MFEALEPLLPRVKKPVQYVGGERNAGVKHWESVDVRWALCYPDAYEVGLPNQGLMILYEVLNERPDALAERTYAVWPDLEALMRDHGVPQFTVDGHRPVVAFDVLGVSFATELGYTNLLSILDLAGIPLHAADRDASHPFVARRRARRVQPRADRRLRRPRRPWATARRSSARSPTSSRRRRPRGSGARETLDRLAARPRGLRARALRRVLRRRRRDRRGAPRPDGAPERVHKRTTSDLDDWPYPKKPLVPMAETVHERMSVEIFRGCTRGCRFCQAGMITRPVRERSPEGVGRWSSRAARRRGTPRSDCSRCRAPTTPASAAIAKDLADRYEGTGTGLSLPSTRVDAFNVELAEELTRSGRRSRPDLRPGGRVGAAPQGDQQDGLRGGARRARSPRPTSTAGGR